jgi:hypothetical protein
MATGGFAVRTRNFSARRTRHVVYDMAPGDLLGKKFLKDSGRAPMFCGPQKPWAGGRHRPPAGRFPMLPS